MARPPVKTRASLTVDADLWVRAREFFDENPEMGSISAFLENALGELMELMPPVVAAARAGDKEAALTFLQKGWIRSIGISASGLDGLAQSITIDGLDKPLFPVETKIPKSALGKKKRV
jgi:hypothetical protein